MISSMRAFFLSLTLILPLSAQAGFGLHASTHFGYGRMGSDSRSLLPRSMGTFDAQLMPGYQFFDLVMPVLVLDYRFIVSQLSNRTEVGSDLTGSGDNWGIALISEPGPVKVLLGYDFRSRFTRQDPQILYSGSGLRAVLGYEAFPNFHFEMQFTSTSYNSSEVNSRTTPLALPLKHWNLGFGMAYSL